MVAQPIIQTYPFQRDLVNSEHRYNLLLCSRQVGKTFGATLKIAKECSIAASQKRAIQWVILSRGERQSKEAIRNGVEKHAKAIDLGIEDLKDSEWTSDEGNTYKTTEIEFAYGSRVIALPANPDTARGFTANLYLDEFAIHRDSRAIWGAAFPQITRNGNKVIVTSTPKGKDGKFYELCTDTSGIWNKQKVTIYDAVEQGVPVDPEELRLGLNDEELWRQEYLCEFIDESTAWLPWELINSVEEEECGDPSWYRGGLCYVGADIARRGHLFCVYVLEDVDGVLWERERIEKKNIPFEEMYGLMDGVCDRYRVGSFYIDQTGMGEPVVEEMQRRQGQRVQGVLFNPGIKQTMAVGTKNRMQDRKVRISHGDLKLRSDLHSIKRTLSSTGGTPKFDADRTDAGHADRFWSLALAIFSAEDARQPFAFHRVNGIYVPKNSGRRVITNNNVRGILY